MAKPPVIGLLGGGQLGRMLCEAAGPLGYSIAVLDDAACPAKQVNVHDAHVAGSFKDPAKVRELASRCDVLTVEIEHVDTDVLEEIATKGVRTAAGDTRRVPVHPSWRTLRLVQDKFAQKEHFAAAAVPVAPQTALDGAERLRDELARASRTFGFPFIVKARKGSYDGRGNFKVTSPDDFDDAVAALGTLPLYAEKWVPFVAELAVMVVRTEDDDGNCTGLFPYPTVETVHEDDVCKTVFMPPRRVDAAACARAQQLARDVVGSLWGRGVFAVEMFLLHDGPSPRPPFLFLHPPTHRPTVPMLTGAPPTQGPSWSTRWPPGRTTRATTPSRRCPTCRSTRRSCTPSWTWCPSRCSWRRGAPAP